MPRTPVPLALVGRIDDGAAYPCSFFPGRTGAVARLDRLPGLEPGATAGKGRRDPVLVCHEEGRVGLLARLGCEGGPVDRPRAVEARLRCGEIAPLEGARPHAGSRTDDGPTRVSAAVDAPDSMAASAGGLVAAIALVAAFVTSGLAMFLLARSLSGRSDAAIVAVIDSDYMVHPRWLRDLVPLEATDLNREDFIYQK